MLSCTQYLTQSCNSGVRSLCKFIPITYTIPTVLVMSISFEIGLMLVVITVVLLGIILSMVIAVTMLPMAIVESPSAYNHAGHSLCNWDDHCEDYVLDGFSSFNCSTRSVVKGSMTLSVALLVLVSVLWSIHLPHCTLSSCLLRGQSLIKWPSLPHLKQALLLDGHLWHNLIWGLV